MLLKKVVTVIILTYAMSWSQRRIVRILAWGVSLFYHSGELKMRTKFSTVALFCYSGELKMRTKFSTVDRSRI